MRLTKFDIIFSFGFILTLVVAVGAFFFGLQVGKSQTEEKYEKLLAELADERAANEVAYHQQQLVSFYHTVLLPFREFQKTWFDYTEMMRGSPADAADLLRQLERLAREKAAQIEPAAFPEASPLLFEGQSDYLRSLTLFAQAAERLLPDAGSPVFLTLLNQDPYLGEAYGFALSAQRKYYEAIWRWSRDNDPRSTGADVPSLGELKISEWRRLTLNEKNGYIAKLLAEENRFINAYPQDISARIDELDGSGQIVSLQTDDIRSLVRVLLTTGAGLGDYSLVRDRLYDHETVPQLPFFFEQK